MQSFDEIYILDLHGNSKKKETAPDGSKDENVFDIQQGVAIALMVKTGKKAKGEWPKFGKATCMASENTNTTFYLKMLLPICLPNNCSHQSRITLG